MKLGQDSPLLAHRFPRVIKLDRVLKAHRLIFSANYGPEALQVVSRAFDEAWAEIASRETPQPSSISIEAARLRLADIVLALAADDTSNVEALKSGALLAFWGWE